MRPKKWFFEIINKVGNTLRRLIKKIRREERNNQNQK